jgi:uncharacterized membrane protein YdjX (TVP38/TMEM64 family)
VRVFASRRKPLALFAVIACVAAAFASGHAVRKSLGIELSTEALQTWVAGHGWAAPAIFFAVVSFRPLLLLPSALLLSVGGLCFGAGLGTALGALGIVASGLMQFALARGIGHAQIQARLGKRALSLQRRVERAGPLAVGVATAHPAGPLTWVAWAAGLSSLPILGFAAALALGGTVRSFIYAVFGSTLVDIRSPRFVLASLLLMAVAVLPLLHPRVFRWVIGEPEARDPVSRGGASSS